MLVLDFRMRAQALSLKSGMMLPVASSGEASVRSIV